MGDYQVRFLGEGVAARRPPYPTHVTLALHLKSMEKNSINSGTPSAVTERPASPTLRQDTYIVLNLLRPSELEWLKQQRLRVAEVFRQSVSNPAPTD